MSDEKTILQGGEAPGRMGRKSHLGTIAEFRASLDRVLARLEPHRIHPWRIDHRRAQPKKAE